MSRRLQLALSCALLLLAFALRAWSLQVDPPSLDILPDQAPWTDEGTISLPVVQAIRGGDSPTQVTESGRPLHILILSAMYQDLGAGRVQGRIASVAIGLLGVALLARLSTGASKYGSLLAALFASTGFFFVIYSRLILTEGLVVVALCLIAGLGVGACVRWQALAVGVLLGAAAVLLKLHALVLLPGLAILYFARRRRLTVPLLAGTAAVLLVWRVLLNPGGQLYTGYIQERLGGQLLGFAPPIVQGLQIVMAGSQVYIMIYQLPLFLLACLEILACILSPRRWLAEAHDSVVVSLFWLIAVIVVVGIFRYTPPRYYFLASPALVVLGISGARRLWQGEAFPQASAAVRLFAALVLGLVLLVQFSPALPGFGGWALWVPLLGLPFPLILLWLSTRTSSGWGLPLRTRSMVVAALLVLQVAEQAALYSAGVIHARADLPRAAAAISRTVPQNALIVGRLAGTLALLAPVRGLPVSDLVERDDVVRLASTQSVWIVMLPQDEADDLDPRLRPSLTDRLVFPVNYSDKSQWLTLYKFSPL